ncbi:MAG: MFS transporter [Acidimicrobiales bacterium]|nr:MFS transporter [Acidimicrobiales bacterium]
MAATTAAPAAAGLDSPRAWRNVAAAFLSSATTLGTAYSFGAFFQSMSDEFGTTRGATAVVFGATTFTFFWLSLVTGRLVDRYGPRPLLVGAAASLAAGLWATSTVDSLTVGYLTYGAGVGIAAACGYVPMVAVVGGWFAQRRALAVGLSVAGIGVGTLIMSPLSARLIASLGWRDTYRVFGVGGPLILLACALLVERPPGSGAGAAPRFREALSSAVFRRLHLSATAFGLGLFVPFVFVVPYAKANGVAPVRAALLVGLLGGSSVIARAAFGGLTKRLGSFRLYRMCFASHALSFLLWLIAGDSFAMLVLFVVVLGVGYGGFVALSPVVLADRLGVAGLGSVLGLFYTASGLGGLIGPPAAGAIIDATDSYRIPAALATGFGVIAFLLLLGLPVHDGRLVPEPGPGAEPAP